MWCFGTNRLLNPTNLGRRWIATHLLHSRWWVWPQWWVGVVMKARFWWLGNLWTAGCSGEFLEASGDWLSWETLLPAAGWREAR